MHLHFLLILFTLISFYSGLLFTIKYSLHLFPFLFHRYFLFYFLFRIFFIFHFFFSSPHSSFRFHTFPYHLLFSPINSLPSSFPDFITSSILNIDVFRILTFLSFFRCCSFSKKIFYCSFKPFVFILSLVFSFRLFF